MGKVRILKGSLSANWGLIVPKPLSFIDLFAKYHFELLTSHTTCVRLVVEREPFGELGTHRPQTPIFIDLLEEIRIFLVLKLYRTQESKSKELMDRLGTERFRSDSIF